MATEAPTVGDLYNLLAGLHRSLHDKFQSTISNCHSPPSRSRPESSPTARVSDQHAGGCAPCKHPFEVVVYYQPEVHHRIQESACLSSEVAYDQADCLREIEDEIEDFIPKLKELDEIKDIIERNLEETKSNMMQRIKFLQVDLRAFRDDYYGNEGEMEEDEEEQLWEQVEGGAMDVDELEEELEKDFKDNVARLKENREEFMETWNLVLDTIDQAHWLLEHS